MLVEIRGDLHVHTCLSPCGDYGMTPAPIIEKAREKRLDVIGICDHNSAANVQAVRNAGKAGGVSVIGGMEITSREEVHVLALFDDDANLEKMHRIVHESLPGQNDQETFGEQLVVDERGKILDVDDRLLIGATTLELSDVVELIHEYEGIAIASHVDREAFSIVGQLGFIPPDLPLDGLEISPREPVHSLKARMPDLSDYPFVRFSDAHYLEEVGRASTCFSVEDISVREIRMALKSCGGRRVVVQ